MFLLKNTVFRAALLSLITLFISAIALAQELTLSEAQKMAEEQSPKIRLLQSDVEIARQTTKKAIAPHLPQVAGTGRYLLDNKFKVEQISLGGPPIEFPLVEPYTTFTLGASLLLFDGFGTWNSYRSASLAHSASELQLERAKFQLEQDIRVRFFQALGAQQLVEVAEQNVKALEAHLHDVENQVKGGIVTRLDVLRVEVQLEDARTDLLAAEDNSVLAQAKLAQAIGVEKFSGPLKGALPDLSQSSLGKVDLTPGERTDRKAQVLREESAMRAAQASKGVWFPKVSIFGQQDWYNFANRSLGTDSNFKDAYTIGLLMTWNLFDGGASLATQQIAAEQIKKSQEELRALDQSIPIDVDFWKRKLTHGIAVYKAGINGVKKSQETVRLAKNAVRAGTRTNTEVLDAERDLNLSKAKVVKSQVEAIESVSNLELALGRRLLIFKLE